VFFFSHRKMEAQYITNERPWVKFRKGVPFSGKSGLGQELV
jgi:hypothetical protein